MLAFYPAGKVMDVRGRAWAGVLMTLAADVSPVAGRAEIPR